MNEIVRIAGARVGFLGRVPGIDVAADRAEAMRRLQAAHEAGRVAAGLGAHRLVTAEQVHGAGVAVVGGASEHAGVDALVTDRNDVCLGIYVADCCAVWVVDPARRCIGLAHSGRKGTELGIVPAMIERMREEFGAEPGRMVAQLSPCIRPPCYEVDFAAEIVEQARGTGVGEVVDVGTCTACNLEAFYSYRAEKGRTGRMLALLALA